MTNRGKLAYDTFWKSLHLDNPMLVKFDTLSEPFQLAWANAAQVVAADIMERETKYQMERADIEEKIAALEAEEMPDDAHTDWPWDQQNYIDDLKEELNNLQSKYQD